MRASGSAALLVAVVLAALTSLTFGQESQPARGAAQPRPDNFYAASYRVEITTPKPGDVVVAGRQIDITQPIGGDVLAAGWHVTLAAPADDDVRIAGAEVTVNAPVHGDLTVAGGDVNVAPDARVIGRSWITGNVVRVNGVYDREVQVAGARVEVGGEIRKPLYIVADSIEILPSAQILAPLTYKSPREAHVAAGAVVNGPVTYERIQPRQSRDARALPGASTLLFSIHLLLAGMLVLIFAPQVETTVSRALLDHPGKSMLAGFVLLVTVPIAAVVLIVSIVGLPLGFVLAASYAVALFASVVTAAFVVGDVEARLFKAGPTSSRGQQVMMLLAGVLTLAVLRTFLGGLVVLAAALFGLGALVLAGYDRYSRVAEAAS